MASKDTMEEVDEEEEEDTMEEVDAYMASTEEQNIEEDINTVGPFECSNMEENLDDITSECTIQQEDDEKPSLRC